MINQYSGHIAVCDLVQCSKETVPHPYNILCSKIRAKVLETTFSDPQEPAPRPRTSVLQGRLLLSVTAISADTALHTLGTASDADIPAVEDEPVMGTREEFARDMAFKQTLHLEGRICRRRHQTYTVRHPVHMRIHGHGRHIIDDRSHDICRLAPHTGELDQLIDGIRHDRTEILDQHLCHRSQVLRLVVRVRHTSDILEEQFGRSRSHHLCRGESLEECRCDHVDTLVRTLCRQDDSHQKLEGVGVHQFGLCCRHRLLEVSDDRIVSLLTFHS